MPAMTTSSQTLAPGALAERERVLRILRGQASRLRARGITSLDLFGSMARGEAGPESDVDLLIEVDPAAGFGLSDLLDVQEELGGLLDRRINSPSPARCARGCAPGSRTIGLRSSMAGKTPRFYLEHIGEAMGLIEQY